ncbi:UDP-N-acetylmuramoyl-L-alanyl-D-glutamate--2,6-diaminopimelate ligase [Ichthyobacterium seriolicida]|uniref:UDP-N-acetylmuramoyl-L-alanyl-D-glutamate--2,6-diaminopimelate ligase n=1 Tax=Ichthyobacterium seriolicida TaxID=242600 RepID=A0A1J1DZD3_9FLAO|nr:UDP-N-acetylmuramoyl-L-alanyl-D-glutamate--2,6-diaminopimelate ligase [Ichthyobacterium seriolicida]BAV95257.1 UDP-N-acetylmuramoylalanyl-D-glutamate--2,6-diaminopimelate ligase [Ichthyobacterium seriolicida]
MKLLKEILPENTSFEIIGSHECEVKDIIFDSKSVSTSSLFVAIKGARVDGHDFIDIAIKKGATSVLCEVLPEKINDRICYIKVDDSAKYMGLLASNFYDNPSKKIKLIGVTGTNGKTTVATLLYRLFNLLGNKSGLVSTISVIIGDEEIDSDYTTPDSISINRALNKMVEIGCEYCFMEVSSHGISQQRNSGLVFFGGIFTNITHDHLDYHNTFGEYISVKKSFFDNLPKSAFSLSNIDDKNGTVMLQNTLSKKYYLSVKKHADFKAKILENSLHGLILEIDKREVHTKLVGRFNAYNILAVYSVAIILGKDSEEILIAISDIESIRGRFQHVISETGILGIVDFAHTPDALINVFKTVNEIKSDGINVICIVGCGGNRDKKKRPKMASIAHEYSDKVFLTSDNPRHEDPLQIISDMREGIADSDSENVFIIPDRKQAIDRAVSMSQRGDIILVLGKGHETYQYIGDVKEYHNDYEILLNCFRNYKK